MSGGAGGAGQTEATNYINFHRGWDGTTENAEIAGFRSRKYLTTNPDGGASQQRVSKLGDVVYSTPTIVGAPRERYDVIYGDATYATYFQQYQTRRQVAYVGANDGMLHAFNAGFFTAGDDPNPIPAGTPGAGTNPVEHGFFNTTAPSSVTSYTTPRGGSPKMGAELWAFVPQELLPHLKWLTDPSYTHVSYVDLRPKVTDVRIFCGDTTTAPNGSPSPCINGQTGVSHPGGWGTIVIAGMRYGGSCGACTNVSGTNGGGPAMTVTADFGSGTTTRTFYSSYVVLDVTDPEKDPALLWTFTDSTLGLTTSVPAVLRVSPAADAKTDNTNAKWMVVFGSGPSAYTGDSTQAAKFYVVDLIAGPTYTAGAFAGQTYATSDISTTASGCTASVPCGSFMSDIITVDANLDYRVDIIYAGDTISNGSSSPPYIGKLYRITTGASTDVTTWGVLSGSARIPTVLISTFPTAGTTKVGPITSAPATSSDTLSNIWVFFGTGRYFSLNDKTDTTTQYFFGVKDSCATSTSCTQTTQRNNLVDVSSAVVCSVCATGTNQVTGVTGSTTVDQLGTTLEATNIDGWFTSLLTSPPTPATAQGERVLSTPTVLGGTIFFSTFIPSTDICVAAGSGYLYALYYLTGTAYSQSAIGTTTVGGNTNVNRSISLGTGLPSQMAVQMGSKGSGTEGSAGGGAGCKSGTTLIYQTSTGALGQNCGKTALTSYSRMISWRDL